MHEDARVLRAIKSLREPRRVYVITSSKGGVGKTTLSALFAIHSARLGYRAGLMDLDLVNPSAHIVLGIDASELKYSEERGIIPHRIGGNLQFFSIVSYTGDRPIALRGSSARSALWESLSTVNWGPIDVLFVDTPPGISDEHLEVIYRLREVVKPVVVANPTPLSLKSTSKLIRILKEADYKEIFLVENMGWGSLDRYARELGVLYVGYIPYSRTIDQHIGNANELLRIEISSHIESALRRLL